MICLINLDAMGDVLMTTALLKPIKKKYPQSYIVWVTEAAAAVLLNNNPLIDKVMPYSLDTYISLKNFKFDLVCPQLADLHNRLYLSHGSQYPRSGPGSKAHLSPIHAPNLT